MGLGYNPYFSDLVMFIVPYFFGQPHHSWLNDYNGHIMTRGYFGVTATLFAVAAVVAALRKKSTGNSLVYFFAVVLLLMMGKFYGLPLVNWIGGLPVANMVNFGKYMGPLMAMCTAVLAGIVLDKLAKPEMESAALKKASRILILIITITFFYFLRYMMDHPDALSRLWRFSSIYSNSVVGIVFLQVAVALFFMGLIVWGATLYQKQKFFDNKKIQIFIIIVALAELFIYVPNPGFSKNRNERGDIFKKAPYIDFLQTHLKEYRVVGVERILYPCFGTAFGIGDIRVLDALLPRRYMEFVGNYFTLPGAPDRFTGDEGIDFGNKAIRNALNLLGVKYIISHSDITGGNLSEDILKHGKIVSTPGQPVTQWVNSSVLNINNVSKNPICSRPARINTPFEPRKSLFRVQHRFSSGSWGPGKGDGVLFEITLQEDGQERKFSRNISIPKTSPRTENGSIIRSTWAAMLDVTW